MMTDPGDGAGDIDFTGVLTAMCTGDEALSEQLAESYLKNLQRGMLSTKRAISNIKGFLSIDDNLKHQRIEWIMGVPQLKFKNKIGTKQLQTAVEMIDTISDDVYEYKTLAYKGMSNGWLNEISKKKRTVIDEGCLQHLKALVELCISNDDVMRYTFNCPAPTA